MYVCLCDVRNVRICKYVCKYIRVYGWMCVSLAPERLGGFYSYLVLNNLFITGRLPLNMNILVPKIRALHLCPKEENVSFLESRLKNLIKFR
jgi:hypothetical protein